MSDVGRLTRYGFGETDGDDEQARDESLWIRPLWNGFLTVPLPTTEGLPTPGRR